MGDKLSHAPNDFENDVLEIVGQLTTGWGEGRDNQSLTKQNLKN
jgi:hypothetical protein